MEWKSGETFLEYLNRAERRRQWLVVFNKVAYIGIGVAIVLLASVVLP